jgi:hypothetical protein
MFNICYVICIICTIRNVTKNERVKLKKKVRNPLEQPFWLSVLFYNVMFNICHFICIMCRVSNIIKSEHVKWTRQLHGQENRTPLVKDNGSGVSYSLITHAGQIPWVRSFYYTLLMGVGAFFCTFSIFFLLMGNFLPLQNLSYFLDRLFLHYK